MADDPVEEFVKERLIEAKKSRDLCRQRAASQTGERAAGTLEHAWRWEGKAEAFQLLADFLEREGRK